MHKMTMPRANFWISWPLNKVGRRSLRSEQRQAVRSRAYVLIPNGRNAQSTEEACRLFEVRCFSAPPQATVLD